MYSALVGVRAEPSRRLVRARAEYAYTALAAGSKGRLHLWSTQCYWERSLLAPEHVIDQSEGPILLLQTRFSCSDSGRS